MSSFWTDPTALYKHAFMLCYVTLLLISSMIIITINIVIIKTNVETRN